MATLDPKKVAFIVIHCSASPPSVPVNAKVIDRWHRMKGFFSIGYHYVVNRDGTVEPGRPHYEVGAHVEGYNAKSLGVCLVGGVDERMKPADNFTSEQYASLLQLLRGLKMSFPKAKIQGHRDFPDVAKACPSFDVRTWLTRRDPALL